MKNKIFFIVLLQSILASCQTSFNKDVWLSNTDMLDTDNPRIRMMDDLIGNYLHKGLNKSEVIELLGKPSFDSIGIYMPRNVRIPDSLRNYENYDDKSQKEKEVLLSQVNKWYKENYKKAPIMYYPIGWSAMDPAFLYIRLDDKDNVVDYWMK